MTTTRPPFIALVGKVGPAFGDRACFVEVEALPGDGTTVVSRAANWPSSERIDATRAVFEQLAHVALGSDTPWEEL